MNTPQTDNYQETLTYLYSQLPMYQREGKSAFKKDLTNITKLMEHFGDPQDGYPMIHIAGTNGKGTTAHLIAAMLQEAGINVGLYSSPHYVDFRERIKINGVYISKDWVINFVNQIKSEIQTIRPSFFEITVAMAFLYFKEQNVDIAVIETGLGGRLDSTNIITPLLAVITNISLDHQSMLGDDVYTIAGEKAGIIKSNTPVVIGEYQSSCDHVFLQTAREQKSAIAFASILEPIRKSDILLPDQPFLRANANTALCAIQTYQSITGQKISEETIKNAILNFRSISNYSGRWQQLGSSPDIIADSAHNADALRQVMGQLEQSNYKKIHFVLGFVSDKDVAKALGLFPSEQVTFHFTQPSIPRAMKIDQLQQLVQQQGLRGTFSSDVKSAIASAKAVARADDLIYIGGSSFVVADALALYQTS